METSDWLVAEPITLAVWKCATSTSGVPSVTIFSGFWMQQWPVESWASTLPVSVDLQSGMLPRQLLTPLLFPALFLGPIDHSMALQNNNVMFTSECVSSIQMPVCCLLDRYKMPLGSPSGWMIWVAEEQRDDLETVLAEPTGNITATMLKMSELLVSSLFQVSIKLLLKSVSACIGQGG